MRLWRFIVALPFVGCSPSKADPSLWDTNDIGGGDAFVTGGAGSGPPPTMPISDASGAGGSSPVPPPTSDASSPSSPRPAGPCSLTLDFTTTSYGGRYSPRHVEAAWVETAAGQFIQTLEVFGERREYNLRLWNQKSGGNRVDAVTGATIAAHRAHTVAWDCIDLQGNVLPNGGFQIVLELTEDNSGTSFGPPSKQLVIPFDSSTTIDATTPGTPVFSDVRLAVH